MTTWHSLYLSSEQSDRIIEALHSYFETHQYIIYNPFGALPGMSYPRTIKAFLAPPQGNWSRLVMDGDTDVSQIDSLAQSLSHIADCLSVRLEGNVSLIHAYHEGDLMDLADWAKSHLADTESDLSAILNAESLDLPALNEGQIGDIPIEALPDELQAMAHQVNAKEANKLFEKLSNRLLKAVGRQQARSLISNDNQWDSQGGQTIRAVMDCLTMPENWRTPDFPTLRTAYAVKIRRTEMIYSIFPGDEEALKAVPDALDYQPIYGGKIEEPLP